MWWAVYMPWGYGADVKCYYKETELEFWARKSPKGLVRACHRRVNLERTFFLEHTNLFVFVLLALTIKIQLIFFVLRNFSKCLYRAVP